ncbi:MAG: Eco57I restriction-modification methylase domain-containing protein [Desulfobacterales bacterium]
MKKGDGRLTHRMLFRTYRESRNHEEKRALEKLMADIRKDFRSELGANNPKEKSLARLSGELHDLLSQNHLFEQTAREKKAREQKRKKLEAEISRLSAEIKEMQSGRMYHNAFEWKFEFPEVLSDEGDFVGFDMVIGNPPYGVSFTAQEKEFFRENYESARTVKDMQKGSTDSFSLFMDKGLQLCSTNAILSYIVPLSFVSGESMSALHNMMFRTCETIRVSTYSNRPQKIFENADQRTAIVICHKNGRPTQNLYTTKVNKRYEDLAADVIKHLQHDGYPWVKYGRIPKVGSEIEIGILQKLFAIKTGLSDLFDEKGLPVYYRIAGGRYYNIITNFSTNSTQEKFFLVKKNYQNLIGAVLSSNLYYWFSHIYSDNLHLKSYELEIFPVPAEKFTAKQIKTIDRLYKDYLADLHKNSKVKKADYANTDSYREYYARHSKQLIDKIDLAVQKAYGLTDEEIRFIINYDLEFRTDNEE